MGFEIGQLLKLKGRTRRGKNKISEHGNVWKITDIKPDYLYCESANDTFKVGDIWVKDGRWILIDNDSDFEITNEKPTPVETFFGGLH